MSLSSYRIKDVVVTESDFFVTCRYHGSYMVINQLNSQVNITLDEHGIIPELQRVLSMFSFLLQAIRKHQLKDDYSDDIVEFGDLLTDFMTNNVS